MCVADRYVVVFVCAKKWTALACMHVGVAFWFFKITKYSNRLLYPFLFRS